MAMFDFLLSKQQQKRKVATEIGLECGLFVMCPICHEVTEAPEPSRHRPAAESLVRDLIRSESPRVSLFEGDAVAVIQTLAQVGRDLPYQCNCHSL